MASAVWSGHLHFGLVVMPVRLLVAARPKTTRFRRLHRKPRKSLLAAPPFRSIMNEQENDDSEIEDSRPNFVARTDHGFEASSRESTSNEYAPVRQILQSEATGEEVRPDEMFKGYEYAPNEFAAIDPQDIKAADVETLVVKRSTVFCLKRCGTKSALELPALGCIGGSTC